MEQPNEIVGLTGAQLQGNFEPKFAREVGALKVGPDEATARTVRLEVWRHMSSLGHEPSPAEVDRIAQYVLRGAPELEISEGMMNRLRREAASEKVSLDGLLDAALIALADEIDVKRHPRSA